MAGIAIRTKFVPNTGRGPKVRASHSDAAGITIDYDATDGMGEEPYRKAAVAFCEKHNHTYDKLVAGYVKGGEWVFIPVHKEAT